MREPLTKKEITCTLVNLFAQSMGDGVERGNSMVPVTIRIAVDFSEFLMTHERIEDVDVEAVDYLVNTIRSGMDQFFSCEQYYRVNGDQQRSNARWAMHSTFEALRKEYLDVFGKIGGDKLAFSERFGALLRLVELQLQFMAANFHQ